MDISSAKYVKDSKTNENTSITAVIGSITWSVPLNSNNAHYQAIQKWVADGNTIEEAD